MPTAGKRQTQIQIMIIYKSPSATITYLSGDFCLSLKWQSGAEFLLENEVQSELLNLIDYISEHTVRAVMVDESDFSLQDKFDLKGWFEFEFIPKLSAVGINRTAIIVPGSRIEEFRNEKVDSFLDPEFLFFEDSPSALVWIRQN